MLAVLAVTPGASAQLPVPTPVPIPPVGPPGNPPPPENPPPQNQPPAAQPLGSPPDGSVAVGVNAQHTGFVDDPNLVPPLQRRWTRLFDNTVEPVRAGDGRIYTIATDNGKNALRALDPLTGRDLWVRPVPSSYSLIYDGGRLFTFECCGMVHAFSAKDGKPLWDARLHDGHSSLGGSPVAAGGAVYATLSDEVVALNAADGSVLWRTEAPDGDGPPAVDGDRVYTTAGCSARAFARSDGRLLWAETPHCGTERPLMPSLSTTQVFVKGFAFDRATGATGSAFFGEHTPVFARGIGIFSDDEKAVAINLSKGRKRWTHGFGWPADGAPIVDYHTAYALNANRELIGWSLETGTQVMKTRLAYRPGDGQTDADDVLAVAPGLLLSLNGRQLTAWESIFRPKPRGIAFLPGKSALRYHARTYVDGLIGRDLRGPNARARLEYDEAPFGRRFRHAERARTSLDGFFSWTIRPDRNVRLRFRSGKSVSGVRKVWVYPRLGFHAHHTARTHSVGSLTVRVAPSFHLAGRRVGVYLGRVRQNRYDLLDKGTLVRTGKGRTRARLSFHTVRHVGRRDFVAACIKGQVRLGLGRPDRLLRHCGARRVQY